jgi:hypothetical protein
MGPITWLIATGPGWLWSSDVATISAGTGVRMGRLIRAAIDVEIIGYRIPWDELTAEWLDHAVVRKIAERRILHWRSGVTFRAGLEIPLRL